MKLTPDQEKHLESIEWLLDPTHIGHGKTTLMLYALMRNAMRYPGRNMYIVDHFPMNDARTINFIALILKMMMRDDEFRNTKFKFNSSNMTICTD